MPISKARWISQKRISRKWVIEKAVNWKWALKIYCESKRIEEKNCNSSFEYLSTCIKNLPKMINTFWCKNKVLWVISCFKHVKISCINLVNNFRNLNKSNKYYHKSLPKIIIFSLLWKTFRDLRYFTSIC